MPNRRSKLIMAGRGRDLVKPAWMVEQEHGIDPLAASRMAEMAGGGSGMDLTLAGARQAAEDSSEYESSSSDDDADMPPGPIDPEKCLASGPGFAGGAAGKALCRIL